MKFTQQVSEILEVKNIEFIGSVIDFEMGK